MPHDLLYANFPGMVTDGTARRYSLGAMTLHWIIAGLIALNFAFAWLAEDLPKAQEAEMIARHKALGITVLLLTILRLIWRFLHTPPPLLETLKAWEAALAKVVHTLFYVLMLALPLAGWIMHSAASGGQAVSMFGQFDFPGLPLARDRATAGLFHEMHEVFATIMLVLIIVHVAAALKHQLLDRDGTLRRMVPWGR